MGFFKSSKESKNEKTVGNNELEHCNSDAVTSTEVEMDIDSIKAGRRNDAGIVIYNEEIPMYETYYERVLILKERKGNRYLPIWIGHYEAEALAIKLQGVLLSRPWTHDFLCEVIGMLGATVENVVISDFKGDCHYAKTRLDCDGQLIEVDCRPSDAINVAVRLGAPIFANEVVLKKASITDVQQIG